MTRRAKKFDNPAYEIHFNMFVAVVQSLPSNFVFKASIFVNVDTFLTLTRLFLSQFVNNV